MEELGIYLVIIAMFLIIWSYKDRNQAVIAAAPTLQEIAKLGNAMKPREAPAPKLVSRFNPKTTYRPIRGVQTQQGSHVQQLHKSLVDTWNRTSPAAKRKIINTWIERARRVMRARILAAIAQAKRSGYRTVQYTGGFGGTIERGPGVTGGVAGNSVSAWEEALGLKPITNSSQMSAAQKKMQRTATDAIGQYAKCENDSACKRAAANKFDAIIYSNSTSIINNLARLQGKADPTQSMV